MIEHLYNVLFVSLEVAILYYVRAEYLESRDANKLSKTLINLLKVKRPGKNTKALIREVLNVGIKNG